MEVISGVISIDYSHPNRLHLSNYCAIGKPSILQAAGEMLEALFFQEVERAVPFFSSLVMEKPRSFTPILAY